MNVYVYSKLIITALIVSYDDCLFPTILNDAIIACTLCYASIEHIAQTQRARPTRYCNLLAQTCKQTQSVLTYMLS